MEGFTAFPAEGGNTGKPDRQEESHPARVRPHSWARAAPAGRGLGFPPGNRGGGCGVAVVGADRPEDLPRAKARGNP